MPNAILIHGYNGTPKVFNYFKEELSKKGYNVIIPEFPSKLECRYKVWKPIMDKYKELLNSDTIVIAHSIGNIFYLKYTYENKIDINKYIGLAGFCKNFEVEERDDINIALRDFIASSEEINFFKKASFKKYAIYSNNDHIVPFDVLKDYPRKINAIPVYIEGVGHMGRRSGIERIEEVIDIIEERGTFYENRN